jgi:hypothetical protein
MSKNFPPKFDKILGRYILGFRGDDIREGAMPEVDQGGHPPGGVA